MPEILRAKVKVFVELFQMRAELARSHALLEQRVADRTAELEQAAERLRARGARAQAGRGAADHPGAGAGAPRQEPALGVPVHHRAHADRPRIVEEAREILIGRLQSLGHAHELLTEAYWKGADLRDVVKAEIAGFSERVHASGPAVALSPSGVQTFALIVHELSTNAAKYGALVQRRRRGEVEWSLGGNGAGALHGFLVEGARRPARAARPRTRASACR